jgi:hypothetical protein
MGEDQTVHLLHICIQLKLEQLFVCKDEQPEAFVTDNNFLALAACLLDHHRSGQSSAVLPAPAPRRGAQARRSMPKIPASVFGEPRQCAFRRCAC